jgi:hypothetical protein
LWQTLALLSSAALLSACTSSSVSSRVSRAEALAAQHNLTKKQIVAAPFTITAFERVEPQSDSATVYIEGDGLAWLGRRTPSPDPTPMHPVALELATADTSHNVIYMARVCQYSKMANSSTPCPQEYWTSHRFAPEVIKAMDSALNTIKKQYALQHIHLVGFSGGAGIAVLLAAGRDDIASIRSVAGNLDHVVLMKLHNVSPLTHSLNPADYAQAIAHIPQYHFVGGNDKVVPVAVAKSFIRKSNNSPCVHLREIAGAEHEKGWHTMWPALRGLAINCSD